MIVLDASMTIAWLFEDERTEAAVVAESRVVAHGAVTPSLWRLEIANIMRMAVRRGRCDDAFVDLTLSRLERFGIEIDDHTDRHAWTATLALSRKQDLTAYDAAYLELAVRRGLPLASCDRALIAAARRLSIETLTA